MLHGHYWITTGYPPVRQVAWIENGEVRCARTQEVLPVSEVTVCGAVRGMEFEQSEYVGGM